MSAVSESNKSKSKDTLSTCDSSSEVSDEGYKSSQGNVGNSASPNHGGRTMIELSGKSGTNEASSHEGDRPESSLTVASECSSTIRGGRGIQQGAYHTQSPSIPYKQFHK